MNPNSVLRCVGVLVVLHTARATAQVTVDSTNVRSPGDVDEPPVVIRQRPVQYRQCLQDAGVRGHEVVEFVIDTAGHVEDGTIVLRQRQGPILDSLAVATARGLVFRPARLAGVAVRLLVKVPIDFGRAAPAVSAADSGVFSLACVDHAPELLSARAIVYPEVMRSNRVSGEAVVEFVVDSGGRPEPRSIRLVRTTHAAFASVARAAVGRARFTPARLGGGTVRCRVQLPFVFEIARTPSPRVRGPQELAAVVIVAWPWPS